MAVLVEGRLLERVGDDGRGVLADVGLHGEGAVALGDLLLRVDLPRPREPEDEPLEVAPRQRVAGGEDAGARTRVACEPA